MKKYNTFLLEKKKEKDTSGIMFIHGGKVLLVFQTDNRWSYPKGHIEKGEGKKAAAIRETEEEVGVKLPRNIIKNSKKSLAFMNKERKKYWYYSYHLSDEEFEEYFDSEYIISKNKLQAKEIIQAKFVSFADAKKLIDKRFKKAIKIEINKLSL
jgi:ADP-ribose pyrophosphatase YjhB (NUDIX family)